MTHVSMLINDSLFCFHVYSGIHVYACICTLKWCDTAVLDLVQKSAQKSNFSRLAVLAIIAKMTVSVRGRKRLMQLYIFFGSHGSVFSLLWHGKQLPCVLPFIVPRKNQVNMKNNILKILDSGRMKNEILIINQVKNKWRGCYGNGIVFIVQAYVLFFNHINTRSQLQYI